MTLDLSKYPNAVTIGHLIDNAMQMEVHCLTCGKYDLRAPDQDGFPRETVVASIKRFVCSRCRSGETEARPHYVRRFG